MDRLEKGSTLGSQLGSHALVEGAKLHVELELVDHPLVTPASSNTFVLGGEGSPNETAVS